MESDERSTSVDFDYPSSDDWVDIELAVKDWMERNSKPIIETWLANHCETTKPAATQPLSISDRKPAYKKAQWFYNPESSKSLNTNKKNNY